MGNEMKVRENKGTVRAKVWMWGESVGKCLNVRGNMWKWEKILESEGKVTEN